ncbi:MAG: DUF3536 domain-containing protein, partial [Pseudomonadota bacterium]
IHGHFYQPPRESPWTGLISPEPGAAPFPNWNERILSESYTANAHAHTMEGTVVHVRNNYESLNFDVGPTLALWLQAHGKAAYRAMVRGDMLSLERNAGHGNAIAHSYNHSILPLLGARSRGLQIAWGIEDFVYRFGRRPVGMWLPECAADEDTLVAIADADLKFVILAPQQGKFAGEGADTRGAGPFVWKSGAREVAIFRFDREMSATVSFGEGLDDGARLSEWIAATALGLPEGSLLMIATDGETFGHHKKAGAAELARALAILENIDGIELANCAQYIAMRGAAGSFEIDAASSWSCAHGVERWRSNCGCRMDAGTTQEWRAPLRAAMEFVKNHADAVYDRFAKPMVADPAAALTESVRLFIEQSPVVSEDFFRRHPVKDEAAQERLMCLFEMERAGQATLT